LLFYGDMYMQTNPETPHDLRQRAEELFRASEITLIESTADVKTKEIIHELRVHQIELEMQNEELRRSQEDLNASSSRYFDLYDLAPVGYMTFSENNLIQEINLTAASMLGVTRSSLIKKGISQILPETERDVFFRLLEKCHRSNKQQNWEMRLNRTNGEPFWALLQVSPTQNGKYWITFTDITDFRQLVEKNLQLNLEMEQRVTERTAELKVSYQEMESFAYSVSHDLRAPLRSIDGFSLAILEDYGEKLDEKGKDYLHRVRAATQKMGLLIDDILKLSRITRCELTLETLNLSELAGIIAEELQSAEPERKVDIVIEKGLITQGDAGLINVALNNLLGNAWKFTSSHAEARIEFGSRKVKGETAYFVSDNGVGFDPQYKDKLFVTFQRLHTEQEYPGTGVGLSLVQHIIHRHGGKVWAEGAVERGATLWFTVGR